MVSSQFHYTKRNRFMPFLLAEILNFQGSTHRIGVGSFSKLLNNSLNVKVQTFFQINEFLWTGADGWSGQTFVD